MTVRPTEGCSNSVIPLPHPRRINACFTQQQYGSIMRNKRMVTCLLSNSSLYTDVLLFSNFNGDYICHKLVMSHELLKPLLNQHWCMDCQLMISIYRPSTIPLWTRYLIRMSEQMFIRKHCISHQCFADIPASSYRFKCGAVIQQVHTFQ